MIHWKVKFSGHHSSNQFWIFRHVRTVTVAPQLLWVSCKNKYTALTVKSDSWTNDSYKPGWFFYYSLKTLRKTYESLNEPTPWINIWLTAKSLIILHTRFVKLKPVSLLDWFSYGNAKLKITAIVFEKEKNIKTWIRLCVRFHRLFVLSNCYMCIGLQNILV